LACKQLPKFGKSVFVLMDLLGVSPQVSSSFNIKYLLIPRLSIFNCWHNVGADHWPRNDTRGWGVSGRVWCGAWDCWL